MKRLLLLIAALLPLVAHAQSIPQMDRRVTLQGPTGLNWAFSTKVDTQNGSLQSPTISGGSASGTDVGATVATASGMSSTISLSAFLGQSANVRNAGAAGNGEDDTALVQSLLNKGMTNLYFPPGTYGLCGVIIPFTPNLHIFGNGTASRIVQGACGKQAFSWPQGSMNWNEQQISDLYFDGSVGAAHTIDTRGEGGVTLRGLYFNEVPAGFDSIYIAGVNGTRTHDVRVLDARFYSSANGPAGNAMIEFGPLSADGIVSDAIGNGAFTVKYGLVVAKDATTITATANHLYNVATNALNLAGCSNCQFSANTWDNANGAVAVISASASSFNGEQIESVNAGQDGIDLIGAQGNTFSGTIMGTSGCSSRYAVSEDSASAYNVFFGGNINTVSCWQAPVFSFYSSTSYSMGVPTISTYSNKYGFSGITASAIAAGSTSYLGVNGAQSSATSTAYITPYTGQVKYAYIATDQTPASGGSYVFTLYNGTTALASCTVISGGYGCNIDGSYYVAQNEELYISAAISSGSPATNVRYYVNING